MNLISVIVICLIAAVLSVLIKQYKPEYGVFISIIGGAAVLLMILAAASPVFSELEALVDRMGIGAEYFTVLLRALGICYIAQLAYDVCMDAGETTLASKIELAAKIAIIVIALPIFREIIGVVMGLIGE